MIFQQEIYVRSLYKTTRSWSETGPRYSGLHQDPGWPTSLHHSSILLSIRRFSDYKLDERLIVFRSSTRYWRWFLHIHYGMKFDYDALSSYGRLLPTSSLMLTVWESTQTRLRSSSLGAHSRWLQRFVILTHVYGDGSLYHLYRIMMIHWRNLVARSS
jgi:hypothetical protein